MTRDQHFPHLSVLFAGKPTFVTFIVINKMLLLLFSARWQEILMPDYFSLLFKLRDNVA